MIDKQPMPPIERDIVAAFLKTIEAAEAAGKEKP